MKYLLQLAGTNIPEAALKLYEHREMLRKYRLTLDLIVNWFTKLRKDVSASEAALISGEMEEADKMLQKCAMELRWNDPGEKPVKRFTLAGRPMVNYLSLVFP